MAAMLPCDAGAVAAEGLVVGDGLARDFPNAAGAALGGAAAGWTPWLRDCGRIAVAGVPDGCEETAEHGLIRWEPGEGYGLASSAEERTLATALLLG